MISGQVYFLYSHKMNKCINKERLLCARRVCALCWSFALKCSSFWFLFVDFIPYTIQCIILLAQIYGGRCDGAYSGRGGGADNDAPAAAAPMWLWWVTFWTETHWMRHKILFNQYNDQQDHELSSSCLFVFFFFRICYLSCFVHVVRRLIIVSRNSGVVSSSLSRCAKICRHLWGCELAFIFIPYIPIHYVIRSGLSRFEDWHSDYTTFSKVIKMSRQNSEEMCGDERRKRGEITDE